MCPTEQEKNLNVKLFGAKQYMFKFKAKKGQTK